MKGGGGGGKRIVVRSHYTKYYEMTTALLSLTEPLGGSLTWFVTSSEGSRRHLPNLFQTERIYYQCCDYDVEVRNNNKKIFWLQNVCVNLCFISFLLQSLLDFFKFYSLFSMVTSCFRKLKISI